MKKLLIFSIVLLIGISACKKEETVQAQPYEKFQGEYEIKSNGTLNILNAIDTTFVDEPGKVIIRRGESSDEIFIYVETASVTSLAPLGVSANAKVDGNQYDMEARNINIDISGISISFNVDATGVLSNDNKTLTSEIVFTGGITGTMTSVGTKK